MSDTPIFDNLSRQTEFDNRPGPWYDDEHDPPEDRSMLMEDYTGTRIYWSGKRWCEDGYQNAKDGGQMFEAWPPYDLGGPGNRWREVLAEEETEQPDPDEVYDRIKDQQMEAADE
jgi:hypothetical protein